MTALDKVPSNLNFLSPLNHKFTIKKAPHVNFFLQQVNLPSITLAPVDAQNPFTAIPYGGDHIEWGDLNITFKVDEDMQNYLQIYNWIRGIGFPEEWDEYKNLWEIDRKNPTSGEGLTSDISLMILTNLKNVNYEVTFRNAFPYQLSELVFNTTDDEDIYIDATASFRYIIFDIQRIRT